MKIAVLSDIHSNSEALSACVTNAFEAGAEAFVGLGDFVNYGADPVATLDALMALPDLIAVLGNHDEGMFLAPHWPRGSEIERAAAWTRARLSPRHIAFLKELPYAQRAHGAVFAHASFNFPDDWPYIVKPKQAKRCFKTVHDRLLFLGHVHVPSLFSQSPDGEIDEIIPEPEHVYALDAQRRYLINVGSVGQPRDGNNRACFVLYDSAVQTLSFRRVAYDFATTADKIRAAGLHPFYADRLKRGE